MTAMTIERVRAFNGLDRAGRPGRGGGVAPDGEVLCVEACDRQWTGMLAHAGDYTIRVGLVRAEARRQGRASYTLHVSLAR
jgi:hypothetical protein